MAGRLNPLVFYDHRGGVNRLNNINQNQAHLILNLRPRGDGTLEVPKGRSVEVSNIGASSGSIQAVMGRQTVENGEEVYSIKEEDGVNDKVYVGNSEITGDDFGSSAHTSIVSYGGVVFFCNGEAGLHWHEPGSGIRGLCEALPLEISWPPGVNHVLGWTVGERYGQGLLKGKYMLIYKDRMYIFSDSGEVSWSNAGVFSGIGGEAGLPIVNIHPFAKISLGSEGDPIVGAAPGQNMILVLTSGRYYIMNGEPGDDADLHTMNWSTYPGVGTRSPKSVLSTRRGVVFYGSDQNVYRVEGNVLRDLDPEKRVAEFFTAPGVSAYGAVAAATVGEEIYFYLPKANNPAEGRVLVYNEAYQNWYVFDHFGGFAMHFLDKTGKLLIGDANGNTIWSQFSSDQDLGSKLGVELISRQLVYGSFDTKKTYDSMTSRLKLPGGESMSFSYEKEDSEVFTAFETNGTVTRPSVNWGGEDWGVSDWDDFSTYRTKSEFGALVSPEARSMRVKMSGSLSAGAKILNYGITAEPTLRDD